MFIYIDESGTFAYPSSTRRSYACVGALTIPESHHGAIFKTFKFLKRKWNRVNEEVKGRELDELQVMQVIDMLAERGAFLHVCATDLSEYKTNEVKHRKLDQAKRLFDNITDAHHPELIAELRDIENRLTKLSDQLFIQLMVMCELIISHLRDAFIHCALRTPRELSRFR